MKITQINQGWKVLLTAALIGCGMSSGWAQSKDKIRVPPQLVQAIESEGLELHSEFKATDELRGLVLKRGIDYFVLYETQDGNLIEGSIIGKNGESLTAQHRESHIPGRDLKTALEEMNKLDSDRIVVEGAETTKAPVYMFVDLNCGYCYYLWLATSEYVQKYPDVQIRWVPVAVLGDDSGTKAAHILSADNPLEVFSFYKANYRKSKGDASKVKSTGRQMTLANNTIMRSFGYSGTPSILFEDAQGNPGEAKGMPRLRQLAEILGKPFIDSENPLLQRFKN